MKVTANGKTFTFPDGTPQADIEQAITDYFSNQAQPVEGQQQQQPAQDQQAKPPGRWYSYISEPTINIAGQLGGQIAAGYAGLANILTGQGLDAAASAVESTQQAVSEAVSPETQAGQSAMMTIGDMVNAGIDVAQYPISGLAGMAELMTFQGVDQAAQTVRDIQDKGVFQTAGDRVFEETGSPLLATAAFTAPELAGSIFSIAKPMTRIVSNRSNFHREMADRIVNAQANPTLSQGLTQLNQQIATGSIEDVASTIIDAAKVAPPRVRNKLMAAADDAKAGVDNDSVIRQVNDAANEAGVGAGERELANYVLRGYQKVKTDPVAQEAIKQGFDDGVIASIKAATPEDRANMLRMLEIRQQGQQQARFAVTNRPSDVAGNNLLQRVRHVKQVNQESGVELDKIAKGLQGQDVEFQSAVDNFITRLDDIGVKIDPNLKPIFQGSDIEGVKSAEAVVSNIVNRMSSGGMPDAYDLHRLKKYIDEQVTYGKTSEGLSGRVENVLKGLRSDLDAALDSQFPEYDAINTTYSDTINALDSLQNVAGRKMDLFGPNSDKAVGTLLRRLMSNAQSRVNLLDAATDLDSVARKYGGDYTDDVLVQMMFADELDSVFGPIAKTSLQGDVSDAVKSAIEAASGQKSGTGIFVDAIKSLRNRAKDINEENAFKAIQTLLERE